MVILVDSDEKHWPPIDTFTSTLQLSPGWAIPPMQRILRFLTIASNRRLIQRSEAGILK
jgi:hypothetical protein